MQTGVATRRGADALYWKADTGGECLGLVVKRMMMRGGRSMRTQTLRIRFEPLRPGRPVPFRRPGSEGCDP